MPRPIASLLNKIPFVRLLVFLVAGIGLQWQFQIDIAFLGIAVLLTFFSVVIYSCLPLVIKFRFGYLGGLFLYILIVLTGTILVWLNDTRQDDDWIGLHYKDGDYLVAKIEEPLVEKASSWKALASIQTIQGNDSTIGASGKAIIYFKKDTSCSHLRYGSQIVFRRPLQEIRSSGNPGSFDYRRYCLFQGITHQVYVTANDYVLLPNQKKNWFRAFIFACNEWVIQTLRKYIPGEKEQGLAEALLIGYKNDLDKDLVQAYSNTGVVHVIAISGLHLGLIYWLLLILTKPLGNKKQWALPRLVIILTSLWWFSIMAGAQPSVLRSALMFSFIAWGEVLDRKASVFNTLALSAFVLLCYNPFWLWDAGFQLSYAAVLSILIFFRPIYNWFYFENKLLDLVWKLNAVTISAQLLTLPVSIYHFHQLPTLFLFTNLVAVPLSSVILIAEILLCVFSFIEPVGHFLGLVINRMIRGMNNYIESWGNVTFSTWDHLSVSSIQTFLLAGFIISFCSWLMEKKKPLLWLSFGFFFVFSVFRSLSFMEVSRQKKLIVYNVPKLSAIDLFDGRNAGFIGDQEIFHNELLRNFHLQPSRIAGRIKTIHPLAYRNFDFYGRLVVIIDSAMNFQPMQKKTAVDILILSRNPKFYISNFMKSFTVGQIVIDSSVPSWKSKLWKKDCDSLHIPCHNVSEDGAFVMNL